MTTSQSKNTKPQDLFDLDGAAERWTEASRKAGNDYLVLYEKTADQLADLEVKTAQATKIPAVITIAETHASVSREVAGAYVSAVRDLLKS
jgi:CO dehydrogenase/acetyl-CoA synthase epsilon subunit